MSDCCSGRQYDLGPEGVAFAATNAAGFLGGRVNFVAVSRATDLSATGFAVASAAFFVIFVPYLVILQAVTASSRIRAWFRPSPVEVEAAAKAEGRSEQAPVAPPEVGGPMPVGLLAAIALSIDLAAASAQIAGALGIPQFALLIVTALALVAANVAPGPLGRVRGEQKIATWLLMVNFVFMGSTAEARVLIEQAGPATWFIIIAVALHIVLLLLFGWIARQPLDKLLLASNATIGGPPTASAFAQAIGATPLITPAVLAGVLGYATATFLALALAGVMPSRG